MLRWSVLLEASPPYSFVASRFKGSSYCRVWCQVVRGSDQSIWTHGNVDALGVLSCLLQVVEGLYVPRKLLSCLQVLKSSDRSNCWQHVFVAATAPVPFLNFSESVYLMKKSRWFFVTRGGGVRGGLKFVTKKWFYILKASLRVFSGWKVKLQSSDLLRVSE